MTRAMPRLVPSLLPFNESKPYSRPYLPQSLEPRCRPRCTHVVLPDAILFVHQHPTRGSPAIQPMALECAEVSMNYGWLRPKSRLHVSDEA